ncbi:MAG: hypothetical protein RMJ05_08010 [Thermomicrobium sp.]|nr:hypothetical protein [Thermomicrobium sp.]MDW8006652.1 hypothetical protein [Thermomicrobium sp.]
MARITGRELVVKFALDSETEATATVLSAGGRGFSLDEQDDELDVTGYGDPGRVTVPAGYPRRSATITIAYDTTNAGTILQKIKVGQTGTLYWYREGLGTGKPVESMPVWVSQVSRPMPHNEQMVMNVTFSSMGDITVGTQA